MLLTACVNGHLCIKITVFTDSVWFLSGVATVLCLSTLGVGLISTDLALDWV